MALATFMHHTVPTHSVSLEERACGVEEVKGGQRVLSKGHYIRGLAAKMPLQGHQKGCSKVQKHRLAV